MKKIRVKWWDADDKGETFKEMIEEELGLVMDDPKDIIEITRLSDLHFTPHPAVFFDKQPLFGPRN